MKWPFYRLMEEAPDDGDPGGGGDPPKPGSTPPADPPKSISIDVLPEELRDRPEAEQKFLLEHMVQSLGTSNKKVRDLETQIAELRGAVNAQPPKPAEPDPHEGKPLSELILEDPEVALDRWAESRGYVKAIGDMDGRVGEVEFSLLRGELEDFAEYEGDIKEMLKAGNLPATRTNVRGAYVMAVGNKALADKAATRRAGTGGIPPTPPTPPEGGDNVEWKTDLEKEIAAAHGVVDPKEWYKHAGDEPLALKLPT